MKYTGVTLCLLSYIFTSAAEGKERILINKGCGMRKGIRSEEYGSFYEQVVSSSFIVDKSLFIENLAKSTFTKVNLITFPRRWGKTTNMKMLQLFLSIEFNKRGDRIPLHETLAYQLFVNGTYTCMENENIKTITLDGGPFLISENKDVVDMYLCQYPVIYFNFLSLSIENFTTFKESLNLLIIEIFRKYIFLLKNFQKKEKKKKRMQVHNEVHSNLNDFINCCNLNRLDKTTPYLCIRTLARLLHEHFGKKAFIIIDEYDYVYNSLYFNELDTENDERERKKILQLLLTFMINTFKNNEDFECGIITGIVCIAKAELFTSLSMSMEFNVFSPEINSFYGFTQSEMNTLMTKISKFKDIEIKQAELKYNGYYIIDAEGKLTKMYNPFAAIRLVESKQFHNYWTASTHMPYFLSKLLHLQIFRNDLQNLVIAFNTSSSFISKHFEELSFTLYEYKRIENMINNAELKNLKLLSYVEDRGVSDFALKLLFFTGCLTGYPLLSVSKNGFTLNLSIPNLELFHWFKPCLEDYYAEQLCTERIDLHNLGVEFMKIIDSPSSINLNNFQLQLEKFLCTRLDTFIQIRPQKYIDSPPRSDQRSKVLYNCQKSQNPTEKDCIYANEALLQAVLTAGTFYTKCLRKGFDIRLPEQSDRPNLLFINRTNVIIIELKYCISASVALEQAKKYARFIYHDEPIFNRVIDSNVVFHFIGLNVNKNKEVHISHGEEKWVSHNETHYSSINETHQTTFDDASGKKCIKNLKTSEVKWEDITSPSSTITLIKT